MRIINALKITNKNQIKTKTHYSLGLHFNSFVTCIDSILFRFGTTLMATDSTVSRQFNVDQIQKTFESKHSLQTLGIMIWSGLESSLDYDTFCFMAQFFFSERWSHLSVKFPLAQPENEVLHGLKVQTWQWNKLSDQLKIPKWVRIYKEKHTKWKQFP